MIQEKVNQLLGIGAIASRGVQSDVKERLDIEKQRTEDVKGITGTERTIDDIVPPGKISSDIRSQTKEIKRQKDIQEQMISAYKGRKSAESSAEAEQKGWEAAEAEIELQEEAMRMKGIQSMQSKGQSSFNQKSEVRSLIDDLRSKKQISHSTYEQMKEALKHNG